jgi:hypothetical protein
MTRHQFVRTSAALLAATALVTAQNPPAGASKDAENLDEPHGAMLERLSSGAIRSLDDNGNLVDWSGANAVAAPAVALDPRVGSNTRLGDDPAALPSNLRAQAEPHIARSPSDPNFLVATFQEGRFTDGSAVNCGYSVSRDGGHTWTRALIPGLTASSGGPYPRVTDPVAAIGLNGFAYLNTLAAGSTTRLGDILVNRSTDGGATFGPPVVAYRAPSVSVFPDKNWITVNTFANTPTAGRIVVTFTAFPAPGQSGPTPIMRVYSDDHGMTWSSAAFVHASTTIAQSSQPVFLPDGKLAIVYWNYNAPANTSDDFMELVVSNDGGNTFGAPRPVQAVPITWNHPQIRDGFASPSATADRVSGNLYVAYQAQLNGPPRIVFTKSADAGATWSTPIAVSDNPGHAGVFNPAIASSDDGQILTIVYYSNRDNPTSNVLVDVYLAQSFDGGATWQPNIRLTSVSTDASLSPLTPAGHMLGDYIGIAGSPNPNVPAVPVWIDNRTGNPDPFVARVRVAPSSVAKADFNADGQGDFVWQNTQTGERVIWFLKNGQYQSGIYLPTIPAEWRIASAGDFNADGHADFAWQNVNNGERVIWFLRNGQYSSGIHLPTIPREWEIASAADFNADGQADFVWQNTQTGERVIWFLRDGQYQSGIYLQTIAPEWRIAGAADFNKDGYADFAWQNIITGERVMWFLRDGQYQSGIYMDTVPPEWRIASAADFNSDGYGDFAWQNINTGERVMWFLRDGVFQSGAFLSTINPAWEIADH